MILRNSKHIKVLLLLLLSSLARSQELTCSIPEFEKDALEPTLKEMEYDIGDGPKTTWVYVEPDITTFYEDEPPPASTPVQPQFNGFAGKFINMSNRSVTLFWIDGSKKHPMRHHGPFIASGTATFPGHHFAFTENDQPDKVLKSFLVGSYPSSLYWYDPYFVENDPEATERNLNELNADERAKYDNWRRTLLFHEQYLNITGRAYLANYLRERPMHHMWRADHFGQTHWVETRETHFVVEPPPDKLGPVIGLPKSRVLGRDDPRILQEYREEGTKTKNMTLKVLSVAPRVFEIENFLSNVEVDHILKLAQGIDLKLSGTGDALPGEKQAIEDTRRTRTSYNSWVKREQSPIIDAVYRRAADLLKIDEALLRFRSDEEFPDLPTKRSIGEQLQLVHYDVAQEYTAHHDFGYSRIENKIQDARFATLLLYLNEVEQGGETSFPRWRNAETFKELKVAPDKKGKAVLFYSQLPDGNLCDFSQHAALPVRQGEKWLINLWVHDPVYEHGEI